MPFYKFILGDWKFSVRNIDKIIIMDSGYIPGMKKYLKSINNDCEIHLFFWNHINENNLNLINDFNDIDRTWTFVKEDSVKYGINLNTTLYSKNVILNENKIEYDVLFVGREKGKAKDILSFAKKLNSIGLRSKIHLIKDNKKYLEEIDMHLTNQFISYKNYLDLISKSSVLLDYSEPDNYGFSMRVLESIYLKKKLITNNIKIKEEPFYNVNNIYIIDDMKKETLEGIKDFLKSEYKDIDNKYLDYYSVEEWIKRFNS